MYLYQLQVCIKKGESNLLMFYKFSGSYFCMHLPQQYILTPGRFHCRIFIVYDAPQVSKFQLERVWGQDCLVAIYAMRICMRTNVNEVTMQQG